MARPARVCTVSGCPDLVVADGRCGAHQREANWVTSDRRSPEGWARLRSKVLRRDRRRCVICGGRASVVDHLLPQAWGGGDGFENLRAMCHGCHGAKTQHEAQIGRRGRQPDEIREFLRQWAR